MSQRQAREWSREDTIKLIGLYECNPCLWDNRDLEYKNRIKKNSIINNIAGEFSSTTENEVSRKLHNLRSQWQNEFKKSKIKKSGSGLEDKYKSNWCYYDALNFLNLGTTPSTDVLDDTTDTIQDKENIEFSTPTRSAKKRKNEDLLRRCNKILNEPNDDDQIFGEYVGSVLRNFSSTGNKKLRRIIQRAIVEIEDEEDRATSSHGSSTYFNLPKGPSGSQVSGLSSGSEFVGSNRQLQTIVEQVSSDSESTGDARIAEHSYSHFY